MKTTKTICKKMTSIQKTDIMNSKAYKDVLKHRQVCRQWEAFSRSRLADKPSKMCIDCFGGGLIKFCNDIQTEFADKYIKASNMLEVQSKLQEVSDIAEPVREQLAGTQIYFKVVKIFDKRENELKQELNELQGLNKFDPFEITVINILYNAGRPVTTNEIANSIGTNSNAVKKCLIKLEESNHVRHKLTTNSTLWRLTTDENNKIADRRRFL